MADHLTQVTWYLLDQVDVRLSEFFNLINGNGWQSMDEIWQGKMLQWPSVIWCCFAIGYTGHFKFLARILGVGWGGCSLPITLQKDIMSCVYDRSFCPTCKWFSNRLRIGSKPCLIPIINCAAFLSCIDCPGHFKLCLQEKSHPLNEWDFRVYPN